LVLHAGCNLIANHLNIGGNSLNEVLPNAPGGSQLYKWNQVLNGYTTYTYDGAVGGWTPDDGTGTLAPGEGAFICVPTAVTFTLIGMPNVPVLPLSITCGNSYLLSRQTTGVGTFENIT